MREEEMIPSYDELFEAYLICDKERYELLDKKHELEAKQIINEQAKDKEIERLNNIINELEKFFKYAYDNEVKPLNDRKISVWTICLDKLKELKENNK